MGKIRRLHLLAQKFLVDQAIENGAAVVVGELSEGAVGEQSFVAQGFVPIGLQNDLAVDGGDDAVDDFGAADAAGIKKSADTRSASARGRIVRN